MLDLLHDYSRFRNPAARPEKKDAEHRPGAHQGSGTEPGSAASKARSTRAFLLRPSGRCIRATPIEERTNSSQQGDDADRGRSAGRQRQKNEGDYGRGALYPREAEHEDRERAWQ